MFRRPFETLIADGRRRPLPKAPTLSYNPQAVVRSESKSSAVTRRHCGPGSCGTAARALSSGEAVGGAGMFETVPGRAENRSPVDRGEPDPAVELPHADSNNAS